MWMRGKFTRTSWGQKTLSGSLGSPMFIGLMAVLFVILGLFQQNLKNWLFPTQTNAVESLGHIAQIVGHVQVADRLAPTWRMAPIKQSLFQGDKLLLGAQSSAMINGPAGWAFAIEEHSQVLFEYRTSEPRWVIHIISGKVRVLQAGAKGQLGLMQDGFWLDPAATRATPLSLSDGGNLDTSSSNISTASILQVLITQKNQLQRCYAEWLQRHSKDPGTVTLGFLLKPSGTAEEVELLGPFTDSQFQSCLSQVVERLHFPRFSGDPIHLNIPLQFEQN